MSVQIRLQLKQWFRSAWFWILWIPLSLIGVWLLVYYKGNLRAFAMEGYLLQTYFGVVVALLGVSSGHRISDFERSLMASKYIWLSSTCSLLLFFMFSFIIPGLLMVASCFLSPVPVSLASNFLIAWLSNWFLEALFLSTAGLFLGVVWSGKVAYLVAFGLAFWACPFAHSSLSSRPVPWSDQMHNLWNMVYDDPNQYRFFSPGYSFGAEFWWNIAFYVFLSLTIFLLLLVLKGEIKKRGWMYLYLTATVCVCVGGAVGYMGQTPQQLFCWDVSQSEQLLAWKKSTEIQEVDSLSYEMDINLQEDFSNTCVMAINWKKDQDFPTEMVLFLDRCFSVDSCKIDGKDVTFTREMDKIILPLSDQANGKITVELAYHGGVNYVDDGLGSPVAFVQNQSAYLPELFAWYPRVSCGDLTANYQLTIKADNRICSNLTGHEALPRQKEYQLQGVATDVYLFSGFITTMELDGYKITLPEIDRFANGLEADLTEWLQSRRNRAENGELSQNELLWADPVMGSDPLTVEEWNQLDAIVFLPFTYDLVGQSYVFDGGYLVCESFVT